MAGMENNNSNGNVPHPTSQQNQPIDFDQPTAVARALSRNRPSKRVKLENENGGDLAGSDSADLYCGVCDLPFADPSSLLLHIKNSSSHEDLARNSEKYKIDEPVEQIEHKTANHSWTAISAHEYPQVLEVLQAHCHSSHDLQSRNYVMRQYTGEDCAGLAKCTNCRRMI
ncbi:hypothetical protein MMC27_002136 [Xylographa pallens]|nr:hypothetical protein [Xylographa pallens]